MLMWSKPETELKLSTGAEAENSYSGKTGIYIIVD